MYIPASRLVHHESKTRGTEQGKRELESQRVFWERWGDWFDKRPVRTPEGKLQIVYVTEDTGVGGGHRVAFQHIEALKERGHDVELWSLGGPPNWFPLTVPVRQFEDYIDLVEALEPVEAIKVATWWNTAAPVWRASVEHGIPVYFVQDIERSYYPGDAWMQNVVMSSYRQEFRYLTTSGWNREQLRGLGVEPTVVSPGIDLGTFHPLGVEREDQVVLALGRSQPLKNFPLTLAGWHALGDEKPDLWLFGVEPQLAENGAHYFTRPSDEEVNELLNRATVFVQTSRHEGFCLPLLEAMATGAPVVCTDADGNRDFIRDGENCVVVDPAPQAVAAALRRVLDDAELRARLGEAGMKTAQEYSWPRRVDDLEAFFEGVAP
jgi:glycosyltransferase involved in cell wall biosynthesis